MSEFKKKLRGYFVTGAKPTEEQFFELINYGVFLDENGNLGVGTESPGEKLEVKGNIKTHGIELSQDIRHNGVPIMGFLESPLTTPATPIRAKRLSGAILRGSNSLSIEHGISSFQKIIGVISHSKLPFTGALIISSDDNFYRIRELTVNSELVFITVGRNSPFSIPVVVFILYIDL